MAATTAMCTSYKVELMKGEHNHTTTSGGVFKCALIKNSMTGTYGAASTNYSNITGNSDEASGTGYSAGGFAWTAGQNVTPTADGTTAITDWSVDPSWTTATFTAAAAMIYNTSTTAANKSCCVLDFGVDKPVVGGTFTIQLPAAAAATAILRIA